MSSDPISMDPTDMVRCPYNKMHKMLRKKLQQHLIKCREYYKNEVELLVCPFNRAHLIPEPEYFQHTKTCTDRQIITHYQHSAPAVLSEDTKHEKIESEENWDDVDVPDYDPEKYASKANIVRQPNGLFPAQRKAFIKEERKRLLGEQSDEEPEEKTTKAAPSKIKSATSTSHRSAPYTQPTRNR